MSDYHDNPHDDNMTLVYRSTLGLVETLATRVSTLVDTDSDDAVTRWGRAFDTYRRMCSPLLPTELLRERFVEHRPPVADDDTAVDVRLAETGMVLSNFLAVLAIAAYDTLAKRQGQPLGAPVWTPTHQVFEVMSEHLLALSRLVQSTFVRQVLTEEGVTAVTPEIELPR